jgi:hypothetical protein
VVWVLVVWEILVAPMNRGYTRYNMAKAPPVAGPFKVGVYDVTSYVVNQTSVPLTSGSTARWKDLIIDSHMAASVGTSDPVFQRRYGRGYFRYRADTTTHMVAVWKTSTIPGDSAFLFNMRYEMPGKRTSVPSPIAPPGADTIRLHTVIRGDSIHVELVRTARHFQLAERQFHWLSEYNR